MNAQVKVSITGRTALFTKEIFSLEKGMDGVNFNPLIKSFTRVNGLMTYNTDKEL